MNIAARIRMNMRAAPIPIPAFAPLPRPPPLDGTGVGMEVPEPFVLVGLVVEVVEVRVGVLSGTIGSVSRDGRSVAAQRTWIAYPYRVLVV